MIGCEVSIRADCPDSDARIFICKKSKKCLMQNVGQVPCTNITPLGNSVCEDQRRKEQPAEVPTSPQEQ